MKVIKADGANRLYVFEDGSVVDFDDKAGYIKKKKAAFGSEKKEPSVGSDSKDRPPKPSGKKKVSRGKGRRKST